MLFCLCLCFSIANYENKTQSCLKYTLQYMSYYFFLSAHRYTLCNEHGCSVEILTLGAIVHSLFIPDRHGKVEDVVTGLESVKGEQVFESKIP